MPYRIFASLLCAILLNFEYSLAQEATPEAEEHHCGTDLQLSKVFTTHPDLKAAFEARMQQAATEDRNLFNNNYSGNARTSMLPVYIVPVVFHIIHDYGVENISDAQILDQMRILNDDFRKKNADTTLVVSGFQNIIADCEIEFRLANLDPNGNCTNGIDRIASPQTYIGDDVSKLNPWPNTMYLNIWVVKTIQSGAAGYAYLPGTAPSASVDGIMILSDYVGSIGTGNSTRSRTLTHEVGHYLNLLHVWGWTNQPGVSCGDDGVNDTPITQGWTSCNLSNNDVCSVGIDENVQNYMEYAYCSRMFTLGQAIRMRNALNSAVGGRNNLSTITNLNATGVNNNPPVVCAPRADFSPGYSIETCAGTPITFTDLSWNGTPTSWNWSFPGAVTSSSNVQNPIITYVNPGIYNVSLTASNAAGSNSLTKTNYVRILPATPQFTNSFYSEGMENATTLANDWAIINNSGTGWARTTTTAYSGVASMRYDNQSSSVGEIEEFISPTIDLNAIQAPICTFRMAYAQRDNTNNDRLRVLVSFNCGQTWSQRYLRLGSSLATAPDNAFSFIPTANEWRQEVVVLNSLPAVYTSLRLKFEFLSDGGNTIYIDDINMMPPAGIASPDLAVQQFSIFPNPAQENTQIAFHLDNQRQVQLQVVDLAGRDVITVYKGDLAPGEYQYPIQTALLNKGIYFVRLLTPEGVLTQKLVVQ